MSGNWIDQDENHFRSFIKLLEERESVPRTLEVSFLSCPDKQQAWSYLRKLIDGKNNDLRGYAVYVLQCIFLSLPDKQQAYNDLHRLISDKEQGVKYWVACALETAFSQLQEKQQVWDDLIKLTLDKDSGVRGRAIN